MLKNGCGQSGHGTLKLAVSQESMEWNGFLHAHANSGKLKVYSMIFGLAWSKMGMAVYSLWGHKIFCILRIGLWIELIFCKLTVMQLFLVRPTSYSTSLTFKCHSAAVVLAVSRAVAGRIQWNRICSSICPTTFPIVFYELGHSFLWILSWC